MILIHGAPGSRLGFINSLLTNSLLPDMYDVGAESPSRFVKLHIYNEEKVKQFAGKKIFIKVSHDLLFLQLFLYYDKNLLVQNPEVGQYHYTHRYLFDKFYYSSKMWFDDKNSTNLSLYDYIIPFENTYDINYLISLYKAFHGCDPSDKLINAAITTNQRNMPTVPDNHASRVAAEVFNFECLNEFPEQNRLWAINVAAPFDHESGECLDPDNLFNNIKQMLTKEYYSATC